MVTRLEAEHVSDFLNLRPAVRCKGSFTAPQEPQNRITTETKNTKNSTARRVPLNYHTHQMAPKSTGFFFPSVFVDTFEENLVFFFQFSMRFENKSHSFLCDLKPKHTVFSLI